MQEILDTQQSPSPKERHSRNLYADSSPTGLNRQIDYQNFIQRKIHDLGQSPDCILRRQRSDFWRIGQQRIGIEPYEFWHGLVVIASVHGKTEASKFFSVINGRIKYPSRITHVDVCKIMSLFTGSEGIKISNLSRQAKAARRIILEA